jgi:hypothetical protein
VGQVGAKFEKFRPVYGWTVWTFGRERLAKWSNSSAIPFRLGQVVSLKIPFVTLWKPTSVLFHFVWFIQLINHNITTLTHASYGHFGYFIEEPKINNQIKRMQFSIFFRISFQNGEFLPTLLRKK